MGAHIIDCCSLLNLLTGWRNLESLGELGVTWHICDAVRNETEYVKEYDETGGKRIVPIDISSLLDSGIMNTVKPETDAEYADYVNYAMEIDDGEAQAIAIAKHRKFVLLSDDRRAVRFAIRPDIGVPTTTTPEILKAWADLSEQNQARLYEIIPRISDLAKFSPRSDSPLRDWWLRHLDPSSRPPFY
jgi:predicted nucleic acid-binding protein